MNGLHKILKDYNHVIHGCLSGSRSSDRSVGYDLYSSEIGSKLGEMWRALTDDEKKKYAK